MHHYDDEIDVGQIVLELWRRKALILCVGLLCAAAAFAFELSGSRVRLYEATVGLVPRRVRIDSALAARDQAARLDTYKAEFDRTLSESGVAVRCGLPPGQRSEIPRHSVTTVVQSNVGIDITVRLPYGRLAAEVASACASALVATVDKLILEDARLAADQRDIAAARLAAAGQRLETARQAQDPSTPAARVEVRRLEAEYRIATQVYDSTATHAQAMEMYTTAPSIHLQRADPAMPSAQPLTARRLRLATALGGVAGTVTAILLLVMHDALVALANRSRPPRADTEVDPCSDGGPVPPAPCVR